VLTSATSGKPLVMLNWLVVVGVAAVINIAAGAVAASFGATTEATIERVVLMRSASAK